MTGNTKVPGNSNSENKTKMSFAVCSSTMTAKMASNSFWTLDHSIPLQFVLVLSYKPHLSDTIISDLLSFWRKHVQRKSQTWTFLQKVTLKWPHSVFEAVLLTENILLLWNHNSYILLSHSMLPNICFHIKHNEITDIKNHIHKFENDAINWTWVHIKYFLIFKRTIYKIIIIKCRKLKLNRQLWL